jgi:hypothetical protein
MGVDDASLLNVKSGNGAERGFHAPCRRTVYDFHVLDIVLLRSARQRGEFSSFIVVGGHYQFPAFAISDAVLLAVGIETAASFHAEHMLQAAGGVIDATVNHLAVA